ncbi:MAG TPA: DUF308 domain-containing protein [Candidatus Saccharimonadales bacterium]|nr:DUF308 domain-containing protein [Candidatus Saccharimonadales bacterium]
MKTYLQATWWMLLLRGLALLLLGFFAVVWPGLTVYGLAVGFAVYVLVVGVLNLITSFSGSELLPLWFLAVVLAALEIGVGVYLLRHLTLAVSTLVLLIGLVLVVRGILEVISAYGDGFEGRHRSLAAVVGILSLVAGVVVWAYPTGSALAFTWVVALYGIVAGAFVTSLAVEARTALTSGRL